MVGFRSTTPLLTGNTQVAAMGLPSIPSVNPGFRMGNTNMPLPGLGFRAGPSVGGGITGTFGGGIDPNIFANYTPSYIPPPPPPPPAPKRPSGGGGGGGKDSGIWSGPGNPNKTGGGYDKGGGGWGPGGGNQSGGDMSGGGSNPGDKSTWSTGGTIPPVYADRGEAIPTMADLADMERRERDRKAAIAAKATAKEEATFKDVVDSVSKGVGVASALGNKAASNLAYPLSALNFVTSVVQGTVEEDYIDPVKDNFNKYVYDPFNKYIYDPIFGDDKPEITPIDTTIPGYYGTYPGDYSPPETSGITKDYTSTSTGGAYDYSPGNIDPRTGQTMTPQTDTIPGNYSPPSVNLSKYNTPNPYMDSLKTAFADFDANFKAEQEAKQKALEDAAKASANAAYSDSTWGGGYDKEAYDRGGWGPDVGGYNDPGAFGGSMGSSPGDKSTW